MEGTRLRILELLQRRPRLTVEELAQTLGLSPATVRRHLDILQRDRLVSYTLARRKPGRPQHLYALTEAGQEALPKGYHRLLTQLLRQLALMSQGGLLPGNGEGLVEFLFFRMSQEVADRHREKFTRKPPEERLGALLEILGEEEFAPEVEEDRGEVHICLHNCPFRLAARANPSVCSYDYHLIATVLGTAVSRAQCIAHGDARCTYVVTGGGVKG